MQEKEKTNKIGDLIALSKMIDFLLEKVSDLLINKKEVFKDFHYDLLESYKEVLIEEIRREVIKIESADIENVE